MLALALSPLSLQLGSSPAPLAQTPAAASIQPPLTGPTDRRALLQGVAGTAVSYALANTPLAAFADVKGANQNLPKDQNGVNKYLATLGLPPLKVPGGFSPLIQYIGTAPPANLDGLKVKSRGFKDTLLVQFVYPSGWILETPSIDENGEAGNIGANNYVKGDSCNFAALELPAGESLGSLKKEYLKGWLVSQMSNDVYEDVKVKKTKVVTAADGTETLKIDFGYTLLTRAGFTVLRQGIASASVVDGSLVGIIAATTTLRYKEMQPQLETIAESFKASKQKAPSFEGMSM